ncbi:hypothetical protein [Roseomonas marmotae]|uniref:Uncharacterized protein n=1 Tax=Roseomonas marmotae TaxID=2768161 RepID=A0ABS3KDX1_9PROT|nr:hypothetical protein [Roseomonas marmotae]MBO1075654.1 hypothetical protein [Roseomonas marmotae]QTI79514.1 hypothetical protein IAI58_01420 [Roseomonas marmotae]
MTVPTSRRAAAAHPSKRLAAAIAGWHRALLNAQAAGHPAGGNPYALLQAVMHDPDFAWLRRLSDLILRIDEANAKGATPSPEAVQGFLADLMALTEGEDADFHARQQRFLLRPEVASARAAAQAALDELRQATQQ